MPAIACGLRLIIKVATSIGLTGQLYKNSKMSNLNFYGTDVKGILNSYFFKPIDGVIWCTLDVATAAQ